MYLKNGLKLINSTEIINYFTNDYVYNNSYNQGLLSLQHPALITVCSFVEVNETQKRQRNGERQKNRKSGGGKSLEKGRSDRLRQSWRQRESKNIGRRFRWFLFFRFFSRPIGSLASAIIGSVRDSLSQNTVRSSTWSLSLED